jgi:hypothetical protein
LSNLSRWQFNKKSTKPKLEKKIDFTLGPRATLEHITFEFAHSKNWVSWSHIVGNEFFCGEILAFCKKHLEKEYSLVFWETICQKKKPMFYF